MSEFGCDVLIQSGRTGTACEYVHMQTNPFFDLLLNSHKTKERGLYRKIHQDIHVMGIGFAAGDGAEDVKILDAHGPEFGEMGFEGGQDVFGLGHENRIAEMRRKVKGGGAARS